MKKMILSACIISSLFSANEKCTAPVCIYMYKGPLSAEMIIINNTFQEATATGNVYIDEKHYAFTNLKISPQREVSLLKKRYDDHLNNPRGGTLWLKYNLAKNEEQKQFIQPRQERQESKIKIEMH